MASKRKPKTRFIFIFVILIIVWNNLYAFKLEDNSFSSPITPKIYGVSHTKELRRLNSRLSFEDSDVDNLKIAFATVKDHKNVDISAKHPIMNAVIIVAAIITVIILLFLLLKWASKVKFNNFSIRYSLNLECIYSMQVFIPYPWDHLIICHWIVWFNCIKYM